MKTRVRDTDPTVASKVQALGTMKHARLSMDDGRVLFVALVRPPTRARVVVRAWGTAKLLRVSIASIIDVEAPALLMSPREVKAIEARQVAGVFVAPRVVARARGARS